MEGHPTDLHDWEVLLLGAEAAGIVQPKPTAEDVDESEGGAIRSDYFALDSEQRYLRRGSPESDEEAQVYPDNPSWIDPESNSRYLDQPRDEGLAGNEFSPERFGGFWSDDSSDGQRSHPGSEKGELGYAGGSEVEEKLDAALDEDGVDVLVGGVEVNEVIEIGGAVHPKSVTSDEPVMSCKSPASEEQVADMNSNREDLPAEKKEMVWWKLPFEVLKFCAFRVKPVWSISIAAACIGVLVLGRRLYKMKQKPRSIPLKISLDEKKASQLKLQVSRLNEAFSVVRRAPGGRVQLPSSGLLPWPVLVGFQ